MNIARNYEISYQFFKYWFQQLRQFSSSDLFGEFLKELRRGETVMNKEEKLL